MTSPYFKSMILMTFGLMPLFSCIKAPVELTLKKEIGITEEEVKEIADNIYDDMAGLDFSEAPGCPHQECSTAYKTWLRKQFDRGLVPTGLVGPHEYAASGMATHPDIAKCRHIDFDIEYQNAKEQSAKKSKREGMIFTMTEIRDKLNSTKCSENFIDPDKEKIQIHGIDLKILSNKLSVHSPSYTMYTSDNELTKEELEEPNAEANLVKDGVLFALAKTKPIPPYFAAVWPAELESDPEKFSDAEVPVVSLSGSVAAIPSPISQEAEVKMVSGRKYYVVPSGSLSARLVVSFSLLATGADAKCMADRFRESVKKEEEERKAQENK